MKNIFIIITLLISFCTFSQDSNFLISENGFRQIKLRSNINDYNFFEKKNQNNEKYFGLLGSSYEYVYVGDEYTKIGETDIFRIFVNTHDNLIYDILVVTAKDYNLWKTIEIAYGKPTVSDKSMKGWYPGKIRCRIWGQAEYYNYYWIEYEDVELKDLASSKKVKDDKAKAEDQFKK